MTVKNPYTVKHALPHDSAMFFGRQKEMRRIEYLIFKEYPDSASIVGERRIGKSSLANRIFHKAAQNENTLAIFLDCNGDLEGIKSKDEFFARLNQYFWSAVKKSPALKDRLAEYRKGLFEDYISGKEFIEKQGGKGLKFIVFLDEFEHLPEKAFADDIFFSNLRSIANCPDNRFAFVCISQSHLKNLTHKSIQSSGFWNIFQPEFIGLLDSAAIDDLRQCGFKQINCPLKNEDIKLIEHYAGAFPFFNQIVCCYLFEEKAFQEKFDKDRVEMELLRHYQKLWDNRTKAEQKVLKNLKYRLTQSSRELQDMKNRGLLMLNQDDVFYAFSNFFYELINNEFKIERKKLTLDSTLCFFTKIVKAIKEGASACKSIKDIEK